MPIPDDELNFGVSPLASAVKTFDIMRKFEKALFEKCVTSLGIPESVYSGECSFSSMTKPNYELLFDSVYTGSKRIHPLAGFPMGGLRFVSCPHMADFMQVRFPRSKKKRIRKKWAKDSRNYRYVPWRKAYQLGDTVFAHPAMIESIRKELA